MWACTQVLWSRYWDHWLCVSTTELLQLLTVWIPRASREGCCLLFLFSLLLMHPGARAWRVKCGGWGCDLKACFKPALSLLAFRRLWIREGCYSPVTFVRSMGWFLWKRNSKKTKPGMMKLCMGYGKVYGHPIAFSSSLEQHIKHCCSNYVII